MKFLFLILMSVMASAAEHQELFNGKDLSGWVNTHGKAPTWKVQDGYLEVVPGHKDIQTVEQFKNFSLHAEFWIPLMKDKTGQDRGNSGIFLQGLYEIQILDSFQNDTYPAGSCGSLYLTISPDRNASLPPEHWQTYDIDFEAPILDLNGVAVSPGHVTVVLNGSVVINRGEFWTPTGTAKKFKQTGIGPIRLQDHGAAVRFRNLWIEPR